MNRYVTIVFAAIVKSPDGLSAPKAKMKKFSVGTAERRCLTGREGLLTVLMLPRLGDGHDSAPSSPGFYSLLLWSRSSATKEDGTQWNQIGGDRAKQSVEEQGLFTRLAVGGIDGVCEMVEVSREPLKESRSKSTS